MLFNESCVITFGSKVPHTHLHPMQAGNGGGGTTGTASELRRQKRHDELRHMAMGTSALESHLTNTQFHIHFFDHSKHTTSHIVGTVAADQLRSLTNKQTLKVWLAQEGC